MTVRTPDDRVTERPATRADQPAAPALDGTLVATIIDCAPDGIMIVDGSGRMIHTNRRVGEIFGYDRDDLLGQSVEILVPDEVRSGHVAHRGRYDAHPTSRPMGAGLHLEGRRQDGSRLPVEISLSPVDTETGRFTVAIIRDVSERIRAETDLRAAHEEVALLEDRERIGRDLHDTVLQRIFATGLTLQAAMSRATNPEVRDRIESAVEDLDETIREIRTAIFGLHHRSSHADALRDAVLAATAEATRVLGFSPEMRFDGPVENAVPAVVGEALVAVLREALSNVARHARAGRVEVEIKVADAVTLSVADDGIGLPPGARHQGGRGMVNMEARARALGGRWQISAGLDGGTVVQWSVPLNEPGSGHA